MPIHLQFTLTLSDYLNAQQLHAKRSWWPRFNYFMGRIGFPIWGVLIILFGFLISGPGVSWDSILIMMGCGVLLVLFPLYTRLRLRRFYLRTRMDTGDCTIEFSEAGIRTQGSNTKGEMEWAATKSFSEDKRVFLIYLAPGKFMVIPKRVCIDAQENNLRALFERKVGPGTGSPSSIVDVSA